MQANHQNKNEYFKLIQKMRKVQPKQQLTVLNTPTGTYYGSDTLEGFASDAEALGQFVGETSSDFDNEFYRLCIRDNQCIF